MYRVTIQATSAHENNWKVVTAGNWSPGEPPQLEIQILPVEIVNALFNFLPAEGDFSGRKQVQEGDTLYAVVFRKLKAGSAPFL